MTVAFIGTFHPPLLKRNANLEYLDQHIEGALRFDLMEVRDKSNPLPFMLPPAGQFEEQVGKVLEVTSCLKNRNSKLTHLFFLTDGHQQWHSRGDIWQQCQVWIVLCWQGLVDFQGMICLLQMCCLPSLRKGLIYISDQLQQFKGGLFLLSPVICVLQSS